MLGTERFLGLQTTEGEAGAGGVEQICGRGGKAITAHNDAGCLMKRTR